MKRSVAFGGIVGVMLSLLTAGGFIFSPHLRSAPPSNNKAIVTFTINGSSADINQDTGEMDITLPNGTNLSSLIPTWVTTGCNIAVNGKNQINGQSPQNFNSVVNYNVVACNNTQKPYFAHVVTMPSESYNAVQNFGLNVNNAINYGVISGTNINITVPSNIDLESITPLFSFIGNHIAVNGIDQFSNLSSQNYTSPLTYIIYANDGTPENYTVNVSKYPATNESITEFSVVTTDGTFEGNIDDTAHTIHVGVPADVILSNLIANFSTSGSSVKVSSISQTSGLSINNFTSPVIYNVISGDASLNRNYTVTVDNNYTLLDAQNITDSMFDNTTYDVHFHVTNHENASILGLQTQVNIPSPFVFTPTTNSCNNITLPVESSCVYSGTLTIPKAHDSAIVDVKVVDQDGVTHAHYNKIITSIAQITELESTIESPEIYAAYRTSAYTVNNHRGVNSVYATATVNANSICFDANYVGTIESYGESFGSCAVLIRSNHDTLYIPAYPGVGGKVLYSINTKLLDGPSPSVTNTTPESNYYAVWQQVEYGGGLDGSSESALFNLNPTNVNFASIPMGISTVISGIVGNKNNHSDAYQGLLYGSNIGAQTIFSAMQNGLATVPNALPQSWESLVYLQQNNEDILRILAPVNSFPFTESTQPFYFNGNIYDQYITDLWAYYTDNGGGHFLYSNDDPIASGVNSGDTCILRCQVTHTDNIMHCAAFAGECPTNSNTGTVDGEYNLGPAPGESSTAGFTEFTSLDFISAAGTDAATTFGSNGTYRSVTGQNIVSGQAVGFLPFCSNDSFVFGNPEFVVNKSLYFTPQYSCLTNYADYATSVIDQYAAQSALYFIYYNYGYSDTLGEAGALYSYDNESYPFTVTLNY